MKLELFVLDPITHLVDINKEWISTIKELKVLLKRDKGSEGDTQARLKLQATREFTFIYHYCDYGSKFINYPEKDLRANALRNAELDPNLDVTKDLELWAAIAKYKELQDTPGLRLLRELRQGLHTAEASARTIRIDLETRLANFAAATVEEEEDEEEQGKGRYKKPKDDKLEKIKNRLDMLGDITTKLPKLMDQIDALEEKVKKQLSDENTMRGGHEKGYREDAGSMRKREGQSLFD